MRKTKLLFLPMMVLVAGMLFAESRPVPVNPTTDPASMCGLANCNLQTILDNVNGGPGVDVLADQLANTIFSRTPSGTSDITIKFEVAGNANGNAYGIYNGFDTSTAVTLLPGSATIGDSVTLKFNPTLAHPNGYFIQDLSNSGGGINIVDLPAGFNGFGFGLFLNGPGGTFYSQDQYNPGGLAQMLAYKVAGGTEIAFAFEDTARLTGSDGDFNDAVLVGESLLPAAEPATLLTLGSGLLGLAGLARRRFTKA